MEKVMNNYDLRRIIFNYLRKYPKVRCSYCPKICVWDKKRINDYTETKVKYGYKVVFCSDCIYKHFNKFSI